MGAVHCQDFDKIQRRAIGLLKFWLSRNSQWNNTVPGEDFQRRQHHPPTLRFSRLDAPTSLPPRQLDSPENHTSQPPPPSAPRHHGFRRQVRRQGRQAQEGQEGEEEQQGQGREEGQEAQRERRCPQGVQGQEEGQGQAGQARPRRRGAPGRGRRGLLLCHPRCRQGGQPGPRGRRQACRGARALCAAPGRRQAAQEGLQAHQEGFVSPPPISPPKC